jgi:uncharacterized membrane protein YphA (DoxX/SURF4 family)
MTIAFWIVSGLLALVFLATGSMKLARSREQLVAGGMGYAADFSTTQVKLIGTAQVLGAIGLILPVLLNIAPVLSPFAALALAVIMVGAIVVHVRRKEAFIPPLVLAVLALVAAALGFATI